MNFQQLNYALAVHRQQHFGQAAISCNVTQATLSGMIKRLEDELGFPLFDRSKHPILTTDKGLTFMKTAEHILLLQQGLYDLKESSGELKGDLKIGIIPTIANTLLPIILPSLLDQYPELNLSIEEITTEEIIFRLEKRQIDLGILSTPLPEDEMFAVEEILYYEAMYVYGLNKKSKKVNLDDLKEERVWLLEEGHCFRNQSMAICGLESNTEEATQLSFKSNSFDTLLNLSDQFGGYTLIPELYFQQLSDERKAKCKRFNAPIPVREISLVSTSPLIKQNAAEAIANHIRSLVPELLATAKYANKDLNIVPI